MKARRLLGTATVLMTLTVPLAACGNDTSGAGTSETSSPQSNSPQSSPSAAATATGAAAQAVCAARDDFTKTLTALGDDVKAGNLGTARDRLSQVATSAADLTSAIGALSSQERTRLDPLVQQLNQDLHALTQARSATQLRSALQSIDTTTSSLRSALSTDLHCPATPD